MSLLDETQLYDLVRRAVRDELAATAPMPPDEFLTMRAVAELAKVSVGTVKAWCRHGKLVKLRIGERGVRVRRADVERLLTSKEAPPPAKSVDELAKEYADRIVEKSRRKSGR